MVSRIPQITYLLLDIVLLYGAELHQQNKPVGIYLILCAVHRVWWSFSLFCFIYIVFRNLEIPLRFCFLTCGTGGSVVEFSPATREARVRFPASATFFSFYSFLQYFVWSKTFYNMDVSRVWHWWFSGRILACHAGGPGSIPGQCNFFSFCSFLQYFVWSKIFYKSMFHACGTGGSVVEFSPATREARVRFPVSATFQLHFAHFYSILCDLKYFINRCFSRVALVVQW